ncbi:hypothetical protein EVAR_11482_1 [Eumeta japonica]|uniref:Uncharacterized protein n=1 Tax=Eumeta variegata TaxID=151549 RepID=A0A4C1TYL6_EUMVA|nr:hypothetical protein EVAR_11482_1 [Eumeta japonica]
MSVTIDMDGSFSNKNNLRRRTLNTLKSAMTALKQIAMWQTWLQHKNEPDRTVKYHNLTEYGREETVSIVVFRPVSESSGGALPPLTLAPTRFPSIKDLISSKRPATHWWLPVSMGEVSEGSCSPFSVHHSTLLSVICSIPTQEAGNALMTALTLQVSMDGGD